MLDDTGRADARPEDVLICRLVARSTDSEHGPKEAVGGRERSATGSLEKVKAGEFGLGPPPFPLPHSELYKRQRAHASKKGITHNSAESLSWNLLLIPTTCFVAGSDHSAMMASRTCGSISPVRRSATDSVGVARRKSAAG